MTCTFNTGCHGGHPARGWPRSLRRLGVRDRGGRMAGTVGFPGNAADGRWRCIRIPLCRDTGGERYRDLRRRALATLTPDEGGDGEQEQTDPYNRAQRPARNGARRRLPTTRNTGAGIRRLDEEEVEPEVRPRTKRGDDQRVRAVRERRRHEKARLHTRGPVLHARERRRGRAVDAVRARRVRGMRPARCDLAVHGDAGSCIRVRVCMRGQHCEEDLHGPAGRTSECERCGGALLLRERQRVVERRRRRLLGPLASSRVDDRGVAVIDLSGDNLLHNDGAANCAR